MARAADQIDEFKKTAEQCPIPAAIDLVGERWAFLILRGCILGLRHFEEFQCCLGIARNILSDRLAKLVTSGILARSADPNDRRKVVYALTEKGQGLLPVVMALRQWGLDWGLGHPSHPTLCDKRDGKPVGRLTVHAQDGRALSVADLIWVDNDGNILPIPTAMCVDAEQAA